MERVRTPKVLLLTPSLLEACEWWVRWVSNAEPIGDHGNIGELEMYDEMGRRQAMSSCLEYHLLA